MTDPTGPTGLNSQRYERLGVLGRGGQGVVYRAFDHWMQRPVAIKVLSSKAARQPETAERLSREQRALSALKGTAAVEVLDICRGNAGELCLVMELLNGENLDVHLGALADKNQRMELFRVVEIFDPIVDTLEIAHNAGILHRDLKPANVFLLEGGGVRLLDFGMARLKRSAPLTADGTVMGSPSFIAPETWKGQSSLVDHRADVYSLGVILFLALAGELPFSGMSLYEKFLGSTKGERPSLVAKRPDLARDADEWVALALAIDREERFQNVRALWTAFLRTFDVEAPKRGGRPSFWTKATGKVRELVGVAESPASADPPASRKEPSFITAALTGSLTRESEPPTFARATPSSEAAAVELDEVSLEVEPTPSSLRPQEPVERTLELSATDFVVEDTLPDPARVEDTLPAGAAPLRTPASSKSTKGAGKSGKVSVKVAGSKSGKTSVKDASSKSAKTSVKRGGKKRRGKGGRRKPRRSR